MKIQRTEFLALFSAIGVLILLGYTSAAVAQSNSSDKGRDGFGGRALFSERMAERLDLDDTQRQSIENIIAATQPEIEALREQSRANREALNALDTATAGNSPELQNLAAEKGRLATELTLIEYRVRSEIHAVLSDEQRAALEIRKENLRDGRRGRKSGRRNN